MKLISGFEKIKKRELLDCRIKSLKEHLNYYGYNLSSFEILILCEAIGFRYGKINYKKKDIPKMVHIASTIMDIHEILYKKLEINFKMEKISKDINGLEKIKNYIDKQIPLLVELDGSVFMKRRKEHWTDLHYISYVLVVGYDEQKREFAVVLTPSLMSDKCITIGYDEFQEARNRKMFPYPCTGKCYYIINDNNNNVIKEKVLKESLKNIAVKMLNVKKINDIVSDEIIIDEVYFGLYAMKKMIVDYKTKSNKLIRRKNKNLKSVYQLEFMIMLEQMIYGTMSCYRKEFLEALNIIYNRYEILELKEVITIMEKVNKDWKKMISFIGKLAKNKEKISFISLRFFCNLIKKIYKEEKNIYILLEKL